MQFSHEETNVSILFAPPANDSENWLPPVWTAQRAQILLEKGLISSIEEITERAKQLRVLQEN